MTNVLFLEKIDLKIPQNKMIFISYLQNLPLGFGFFFFVAF